MPEPTQLPEGMVLAHAREALRLGMYHMACAEQHFRSSGLDAYSRQIADNLESVRSLQAHALKILQTYEDSRKQDRVSEHEF